MSRVCDCSSVALRRLPRNAEKKRRKMNEEEELLRAETSGGCCREEAMRSQNGGAEGRSNAYLALSKPLQLTTWMPA